MHAWAQIYSEPLCTQTDLVSKAHLAMSIQQVIHCVICRNYCHVIVKFLTLPVVMLLIAPMGPTSQCCWRSHAHKTASVVLHGGVAVRPPYKDLTSMSCSHHASLLHRSNATDMHIISTSKCLCRHRCLYLSILSMCNVPSPKINTAQVCPLPPCGLATAMHAKPPSMRNSRP